MRKLLFILISLFIVYFLIQTAFVYFGNGHEVNYEIKYADGVAKINEKFFNNVKKEKDSYYISVELGEDKFYFQIFDGFGKSSSIVKSIEYFKDDEVSCIFPVFRNDKILFDVMCNKDNVIIPFNSLTDVSEDLMSFVDSLKNKGYNIDDYKDDKSKTKEDGPLTVYVNNLMSNHYLSVNNYKGIYKINAGNDINNVEIFSQDVYKQFLSGYTNNTYVAVDYLAVNTFNKFYYSRLEKDNYSTLITGYDFSFNSYIQGAVGDSIYLFDRSAKKQYEINFKTLGVLEVGNVETGIKYYNNGEWSRVDVTDKDILFGSNYMNDYVNDNYNEIVRYGKDSGYYYLYKKVGKKYDVYRADVYNKDYITYLFSTTNINTVEYFDNYVYYVDGNDVKFYSDKTGNKTVFTNKEFEFNQTLIWSVYESSK